MLRVLQNWQKRNKNYLVYIFRCIVKEVFNFALLNVFYAIDALHRRIESRDKHLFDAGMISEQAMARTLYMIKELADKLDAYGVEPS